MNILVFFFRVDSMTRKKFFRNVQSYLILKRDSSVKSRLIYYFSDPRTFIILIYYLLSLSLTLTALIRTYFT